MIPFWKVNEARALATIDAIRSPAGTPRGVHVGGLTSSELMDLWGLKLRAVQSRIAEARVYSRSPLGAPTGIRIPRPSRLNDYRYVAVGSDVGLITVLAGHVDDLKAQLAMAVRAAHESKGRWDATPSTSRSEWAHARVQHLQWATRAAELDAQLGDAQAELATLL